MLTEYDLNVSAEIVYAQKWALSRNPAYYDFDSIGGDCTNFISQCLYAGGAVMNYTRDIGWYYASLHDRAAAWTGVEYFYRFIVQNQGIGPFGYEIPLNQIRLGDVIQLGTGKFHHTLLVIDLLGGMPYIAAHTQDAFHLPLSAYQYDRIRCLRLTARK